MCVCDGFNFLPVVLTYTELEVMEQHKKLKEEVVSSAMVSVPVSITQTVTPDYAAGLIVPAIAVSIAVTLRLCCLSSAPGTRLIYCTATLPV